MARSEIKDGQKNIRAIRAIRGISRTGSLTADSTITLIGKHPWNPCHPWSDFRMADGTDDTDIETRKRL